MDKQTNIQGDNNIVIKDVSDSTITLNINGENQKILKQLNVLQALLENLQTSTFQSFDKTYNIAAFSEKNFDFFINQVNHNNELPIDLSDNLITYDSLWIQSLRQELLKQNVSVGNNPWMVFQHYGWLIESSLQKMETPIGKQPTLRRLSFMAEVFQSSLRYLCFVQILQIIRLEKKVNTSLFDEFFKQDSQHNNQFSYLNFLLVLNDILQDEVRFMKEIDDLVNHLTDVGSDLYGAVLYLETNRTKLLEHKIEEQEERLSYLLDAYLTALVFWLRQIAFLAKYRLVSIKDINLKYRLGTPKNFVHLYGELHGVYGEDDDVITDYSAYSVKEDFTFNQSVLLFKGSSIQQCLENINTNPPLSLSPLIIDTSVYTDKPTQTPDIYYFTGRLNRIYFYAQYKNESTFGEQEKIATNKYLQVKRQNIKQPKLDELFEQLEEVLKLLMRPKR